MREREKKNLDSRIESIITIHRVQRVKIISVAKKKKKKKLSVFLSTLIKYWVVESMSEVVCVFGYDDSCLKFLTGGLGFIAPFDRLYEHVFLWKNNIAQLQNTCSLFSEISGLHSTYILQMYFASKKWKYNIAVESVHHNPCGYYNSNFLINSHTNTLMYFVGGTHQQTLTALICKRGVDREMTV